MIHGLSHQCKYICWIDKNGQRRGVCPICDEAELIKIHDETRGTYNYTRYNDSINSPILEEKK